MKPLQELMTEDEFVLHGMRIVKLFHPIQPSDEEFLAVRLADDAPGDMFIQMMQSADEMLESANEMLALWHAKPEGNA